MTTTAINDQNNTPLGKFTRTIKSTSALDWLNFLIADVKDGLGPFLAIYLFSSQHWDSGQIGIIMMIGGTATALARAPMGALIDWSSSKRGLIVGAAVVVAICSLLITWFHGFWAVAVAQTVIGVADALLPSAIAAISLGLVGSRAITYRIGRNEAFNHAGNVVTALLAGVAGWALAQEAMLWLVALAAVFSIVAVLSIKATAIDNDKARGMEEHDHNQQPVSLRELFQSKPLQIFAALITLFHFANAAMLPMLGQELAQSQPGSESLVMAACIITAQIVMIPTAMLVGSKADIWGRKAFFLVGFAVLPLRGLLYTFSQDPIFLVSIQVLDGIGAGIFGALFFIVVADLTKGTGHYGFALGVLSTCWSLGAAMSHMVAGLIVDSAGFDAAFLFLSGIALIAFLLYWIAMPETGPAKLIPILTTAMQDA